MRSFRWARPASLDDAVELMAELGASAAPLAGGQSLLLGMKARQHCPSWVVSLAELEELSGVEITDGELTLGPTTTYGELERMDTNGPATLAHIRSVVSRIADTAVRSLATVGGAACSADPAFDVPALLTACDARLVLLSLRGTRELSAEDFFLGPGHTARAPDEILRSIRIATEPDVRHGFAKLGFRTHDAALASVAITSHCSGTTIDRVRVVVGGCVDHPQRAPVTEKWLVGRPLQECEHEVGAVLSAEIEPTISTTPFSAGYRRRVLAPLVREAVAQASEQGGML